MLVVLGILRMLSRLGLLGRKCRLIRLSRLSTCFQISDSLESSGEVAVESYFDSETSA